MKVRVAESRGRFARGDPRALGRAAYLALIADLEAGKAKATCLHAALAPICRELKRANSEHGALGYERTFVVLE